MASLSRQWAKQYRGVGKLLSEAARLRSAAAAAIAEAARLRGELEVSGLEWEPGFLNAFELLSLHAHDVAVLMHKLADAKSSLEGNLFARLLVLEVYETARVLRRLLARDFQRRIGAVLGGSAQREAEVAHSAIQHLFERVNRDFGLVRNSLSAHRTLDAEVRNQLLVQLDPLEVFTLASQVLVAVRPLMPLMAPYTRRAGRARVPQGA